LHPDRHLQSDPAEAAAAAGRMRDVNAAWAVLSDRTARRSYDLDLDARRDGAPSSPSPASRSYGTSSSGARQTRTAGPADAPARYSEAVAGHSVIRGVLWLFLVGLLGAIFVFTAYAAGGGDGTGTTTVSRTPGTTAPPPVRRGSCVAQQAGWLDVVPCDGPHDAEAVDVVPIGRPCPGGSDEVYLPGQQESACLKSVSATAPR
jgi:hypothetical protein